MVATCDSVADFPASRRAGSGLVMKKRTKIRLTITQRVITPWMTRRMMKRVIATRRRR